MRPIRNIAAAAMLLLGPGFAFAQFSFTDLTGVFSSSNLVGISPDGTTILGQSPDLSGFGQPLYYRNGQITYLPILTYGNGIARRMALDGTIVGGVLRGHEQGTDDAGVWRNDQISLIEHEPGGLTTDATAISLDGHVIVGSSDSSTHFRQPTRWVDGHVQTLGDIPGTLNGGEALAVNADGSVVVGQAGGFRRAFRWQNGAIEPLPLIDPNSDIETSYAVDTSADGRRIIGRQMHSNFVSDGLLWQDGVVTKLGSLPGGTSAFPAAISADGSLIFGDAGGGALFFTAFVWDELHGMRDLMQVLLDGGADLHGWTRLDLIQDVSADGHTILGYGFNAQGAHVPFVATIPEPATLSVAAAAFVLFGIRGGRGRKLTGHSENTSARLSPLRADVPHFSTAYTASSDSVSRTTSSIVVVPS